MKSRFGENAGSSHINTFKAGKLTSAPAVSGKLVGVGFLPHAGPPAASPLNRGEP